MIIIFFKFFIGNIHRDLYQSILAELCQGNGILKSPWSKSTGLLLTHALCPLQTSCWFATWVIILLSRSSMTEQLLSGGFPDAALVRSEVKIGKDTFALKASTWKWCMPVLITFHQPKKSYMALHDFKRQKKESKIFLKRSELDIEE